MSSPSHGGSSPQNEGLRARPEFDRCLMELHANGFVDAADITERYPEFASEILEDLELYLSVESPESGPSPRPLGTLGDTSS